MNQYQSKIRDFYQIRSHAEQIFRLHVSVKEPVFVHKRQPLQYLIHHKADLSFRKYPFPVEVNINVNIWLIPITFAQYLMPWKSLRLILSHENNDSYTAAKSAILPWHAIITTGLGHWNETPEIMPATTSRRAPLYSL